MVNIFDSLEKYENYTAVITEKGIEVSYGDLVRMADEVANKAEPRSLVFSICRNCTESVAGYIGFLRKRIVPLLLNESLHEDLFVALMENYRPKYIYAPIEKINEKLSKFIVYTCGEYALVRTNYEIDYTMHDHLALLLTTSGSTGSSKLVRQSYRNIEANTKSIVKYLKINKKDRAITTLPMSYTYGLSIINTHLYSGASIILTEATLMNKAFWKLLKEQKATTFGGVPYTYEIFKKLRFAKMDLPSLRYITQAGGKLSKELSEEFAQICIQKGIEMIVMYGQTEATARMSYLPWKYAISKAGSIGIPIPGGKLWIEDVNNCTIEECEIVGELIYRGENVTLGYAEVRHDLIKEDENQGVLHTGDMAKLDSDGFYHIVGRKKRFLKLFGSRVNLDEMERLLKKERYDCVCVGEDDELRIYVTGTDKIEEVRHFILSHTDINRAGFKVFAIDSIPRNESGKVLYSELR